MFVVLPGVVNANQDVVRNNPVISLIEDTHVNVEACFSIDCVKYLLKYIYKSHDRATYVLHAGGSFDVSDKPLFVFVLKRDMAPIVLSSMRLPTMSTVAGCLRPKQRTVYWVC